jgi:hypothetical protein
MEKQVIYCEIAYANTIACFPVKNTQDYKNKLNQLKANYDNVSVLYREWSDGTIEDGELED